MSSQARVAASRSNGGKSGGPRTTAGKSTARLNALRHGLYAITNSDLTLAPRVERIAGRLCGDDPNPLLHEQALIIAEKQVLLARVREARIAAIEKRLADIKKVNKENDKIDRCDERGSVDAEAREPTGAREMHGVEAELEFEAMWCAPLSRLERLERRAWRQFSRAVDNFIAVKCGNNLRL
jgi:hypothetical protein